MIRWRSLTVMAVFLATLAIMARDTSAGQNKPPKWKVRQNRKIAHEKAQRKRARHYKYVNNHDLNNDGVVDSRDRLIWLKNRDGNYGRVYVSAENEDVVEVMDIDGDGSVESWEMEAFYDNYDLNGDGVLDEYELNQAVD